LLVTGGQQRARENGDAGGRGAALGAAGAGGGGDVVLNTASGLNSLQDKKRYQLI
jgi:hypothetical protein